MKKIIQIICCILLIVDLYLIYVYNLHDGWNKLERRIFGIALILGSISSILMIYQKKRLKEDKNEK
jgi:hypothetical protein